MAYVSRDIKDRIAEGDDLFYIQNVGAGVYKLIPAPTSVTEPGTPINKSLLQLMEDRIVYLMNRLADEITSNPFNMSFATLQGLSVTGVWNEDAQRIEC